MEIAGKLACDAVLFDDCGSALQGVFLRNDGNSAAAAGNDNLIGISQCADSVDFQDIDRLGSRHDTAEALAGFFNDKVSFFCSVSASSFDI